MSIFDFNFSDDRAQAFGQLSALQSETIKAHTYLLLSEAMRNGKQLHPDALTKLKQLIGEERIHYREGGYLEGAANAENEIFNRFHKCLNTFEQQFGELSPVEEQYLGDCQKAGEKLALTEHGLPEGADPSIYILDASRLTPKELKAAYGVEIPETSHQNDVHPEDERSGSNRLDKYPEEESADIAPTSRVKEMFSSSTQWMREHQSANLAIGIGTVAGTIASGVAAKKAWKEDRKGKAVVFAVVSATSAAVSAVSWTQYINGRKSHSASQQR